VFIRKTEMVRNDLLNPLKRWILTNKYFIKTTDTKERKSQATHFLLDGGIWCVPKESYPEFLRLLAIDLQHNEKHYICENRTPVFKFICDIDMYEDTVITVDQIKIITVQLQEVVKMYFGSQKVIICGSDSKKTKVNEIEMIKSGFHLVWSDIWISTENAKKVRHLFIERLLEHFGERENSFNTWSDVIDLAVYEDNGLRMVGCRKISPCKACKNKKEFRDTCETCQNTGKIDENRVYSPKCVLGAPEKFVESLQNHFVMVSETSIYNYNNVSETHLLQELNVHLPDQKKKKGSKKPVVDDLAVKIENFIKRNLKRKNVKISKVTKLENIYFAEPEENFCMNVNRNHTSSGVYFQITPSGLCQRCYCKRETLDGRLHGMCKEYSSEVVPLSKILHNVLFGNEKNSKNKKEIVNVSITRNQSNVSLDLSMTSIQNHKETISNEKMTCLVNCKNILSQIEKQIKAN